MRTPAASPQPPLGGRFVGFTVIRARLLEFELAISAYRAGEVLVPALTALALGAAVALAGSLEMAWRTMDLALERGTRALEGRADLEVVAGGLGLPESLLDVVRAVYRPGL